MENIEKFDLEGNSPLHHAILFEDFEIVSKLVLEKKYINIINKYGLSPLCLAISEGLYNSVKLLLENGAEFDFDSIVQIDTLLECKDEEIVNLIFYYNSGLNINHAILFGKLNLVKKLFFKDNDKEDNVNDYLILASGSLQKELVQFFIENGADINFRTEYGSTPLVSATGHNQLPFKPEEQEHLKFIRFLLTLGANRKKQGRFSGPPYRIAIRKEYFYLLPDLYFDKYKFSKYFYFPFLSFLTVLFVLDYNILIFFCIGLYIFSQIYSFIDRKKIEHLYFEYVKCENNI